MCHLSHKKRKFMDQSSLSLKLFKKQQSKTKEKTLLLKRKRQDKQKAVYKLKEPQPFIIKKKALLPFNSSFLTKSKKGQIIIETLFLIISLLSFLLAVQFFQSSARKEIQKQRLSKERLDKTSSPKAPWHR